MLKVELLAITSLLVNALPLSQRFYSLTQLSDMLTVFLLLQYERGFCSPNFYRQKKRQWYNTFENIMLINLPWPRGYKTFFMLNSIEHEILNAHEYENIKKFSIFQAQISLECYFFLLINVKMPTVGGILTFISRKNFMLN